MPFVHLTMNVSLMRSVKTENVSKMTPLNGNVVLDYLIHQKRHVEE